MLSSLFMVLVSFGYEIKHSFVFFFMCRRHHVTSPAVIIHILLTSIQGRECDAMALPRKTFAKYFKFSFRD